jgi:hypothetical protein
MKFEQGAIDHMGFRSEKIIIEDFPKFHRDIVEWIRVHRREKHTVLPILTTKCYGVVCSCKQYCMGEDAESYEHLLPPGMDARQAFDYLLELTMAPPCDLAKG